MDLGIGGVADAVELRAANGIATYKAHHERLQRPVVVKLLPPEAADTHSDEMEMLSTVTKGPGIVKVQDFGMTVNGHPYQVTDYCKESLLDRLTERGPMGPFRACAVLAEIADAVFFAHQRGVVHGNIRPSNIMDDDGQFLLTDFGAAGAVSFDGGVPKPSPAYVAPEDLDGKRSASTNSDVYALGSTLYHLVTGQAPFADRPASAVSRKIPDLRSSALPEEVCEVIESAMARQPGERPSIGALRQTLQRTARAGGQTVGEARPSRRPSLDRNETVDHEPVDDVDERAASEPVPKVDASPLGPNAVPVRGTAAQVRELRSARQKEEKSDTSWTSTALAIALFVGAIGILFFGLRANSSGDRALEDQSTLVDESTESEDSAQGDQTVTGDVTVPDVTTSAQAEALAQLQGLGMQVSLDFEPSETVASGSVIRTEPPAGGVVSSGESVALFVSNGPPVEGCSTSVVPDIDGAAAAPAREAVVDAGLEPVLAQQASQEVVPGNVISSSLVAGDCVATGTPLTIVISCTSITIPELDEFSASALEEQGLNVVTRNVLSDSAAPGTLLETSPPAGTAVCSQSTVTVNIAAAGDCPQVPDVVGRSQIDAVATMDALGYVVQTRSVASESVPAGQVVGSTPVRGTPLCADGSITLDVSSGSGDGSTTTIQDAGSTENDGGTDVSIPYVAYLNVSDAERILTEAGLVPQIGEFRSISADHPFVGTVRSTNPGPEVTAQAGSSVELVVWCAEPCE